jgi:hypothetical protein
VRKPDVSQLAIELENAGWLHAGVTDLLHRRGGIVALREVGAARSVTAHGWEGAEAQPDRALLARRQASDLDGYPEVLAVGAEDGSTGETGRPKPRGWRLDARTGVDERRGSPLTGSGDPHGRGRQGYPEDQNHAGHDGRGDRDREDDCAAHPLASTLVDAGSAREPPPRYGLVRGLASTKSSTVATQSREMLIGTSGTST